MGIIVSVYRNTDLRGDCTNGGVSSRFTRLCVVNVEGPCQPSDDCPAVELQAHYKQEGRPALLRIVPLEAKGKWVMFGGNYAACSDSRFSKACEDLAKTRFYGAVAIHDRVE